MRHNRFTALTGSLFALALLLAPLAGCADAPNEEEEDEHEEEDEAPQPITAVMTFDFAPENVHTADFRFSDGLTQMREEIELALSDEVLLEAAQHPATEETRWARSFAGDTQQIADALRDEVITVTPVENVLMFEMRATAMEPDDAMALLTAVSEVYLHTSAKHGADNSDQARSAQAAFDEAGSQLIAAQRELDSFLRSNSPERMNAELAVATQRIRQANLELDECISDSTALQASYRQQMARVANNFEPNDEQRQRIESSPEITAIDAQLRELNVALETYRQQFAPSHRLVIQAQAQITALGEQREETIERLTHETLMADAQSTEQAIRVMQLQVRQLQSDLELAQETHRRASDQVMRYESGLRSFTTAAERAEQNRDIAAERLEMATRPGPARSNASRVTVIVPPAIEERPGVFNWLK